MEVKDRSFIEIKDAIVTALHDVYDPEIPVNIYELGLIYEVNVDPSNNAHIVMTLTSPNCPVAESLPQEVKETAEAVDGIGTVEVELVFEPEWTMDSMSETAKLELGLL
ncbi:MAG: SUF system Fe-S cluster assembly protein [Bacteroidetes bacterium]|nr:SUF system Fe-S cluster assembly protein [Bacteroidota bacterium]